MTEPALIERITRSLAFMLRHQPEQFDLELDAYGFADLPEVVRALNERLGEPVTEDDVSDAVTSGDRERYEIQGDTIRALYGHSIPVEPGAPSKPPEVLYVALPEEHVDRAQRFGLRGGRRRFLHLALSVDDARESGRRGAVDYTVLSVQAIDAWEEGVNFYDRRSLWLAEEIPTHHLEEVETFHDGEAPRRPLRGRGDRGDRSRSEGRESRERRPRGGRERGSRDDRSRSSEGRDAGRGEAPPREDARGDRDREPSAREGGSEERRDRGRGRGRGRGRDRGGRDQDRDRGRGRSGSVHDDGRERRPARDRDDRPGHDRDRPAPDRERPDRVPARASSSDRPGSRDRSSERPRTEREPARAEARPSRKPSPRAAEPSASFGAGVIDTRERSGSVLAPSKPAPSREDAPVRRQEREASEPASDPVSDPVSGRTPARAETPAPKESSSDGGSGFGAGL